MSELELATSIARVTQRGDCSGTAMCRLQCSTFSLIIDLFNRSSSSFNILLVRSPQARRSIYISATTYDPTIDIYDGSPSEVCACTPCSFDMGGLAVFSASSVVVVAPGAKRWQQRVDRPRPSQCSSPLV